MDSMSVNDIVISMHHFAVVTEPLSNPQRSRLGYNGVCTRWLFLPVLSRYFLFLCQYINTLRPRQNCRHFTDDIFKCILLYENVWISPKISLKFVPKVSINNITALVQIMDWRRLGDKPLCEPMMASLLTHTYVTWPLWVNSLVPEAQYGNSYDHSRYDPLKMAESGNGKLNPMPSTVIYLQIGERLSLKHELWVIVNIIYQCQQRSSTAYTRNYPSKEKSCRS